MRLHVKLDLIIDVDGCASQPCNNSRNCLDIYNGATCNCISGQPEADCEISNIYNTN